MKTNLALELKDDNAANPVETVAKAIEALNTKVDAKLAAVETKSAEAAKADAAKVTDRLDKIEAKMQRPATAANDDNKVLETKAAAKASFSAYARTGRGELSATEIKAMTTGDDTTAGYLVPPEISAELLTLLTQYSPIRSAARVGVTGSTAVKMAIRLGLTNASWEGETQPEGDSNPVFGQLEIPVFGMKTAVPVSVQTLEDSVQDIAGIINQALAEDFGKKEGSAFVNGTGIGQPRGFMVHPDVGSVANGHATVLQVNGLIDLFHSVPAAYRSNGTWVLNSTSIAAVRKLVSTSGVPLWQDSLAAGNPPTILGRPVMEAIDMPGIASATFPIAFGDFSNGYRIFDRVQLVLLRDPFTRAQNGFVVFHARRRVGGDVVKAEAIKKLSMVVS